MPSRKDNRIAFRENKSAAGRCEIKKLYIRAVNSCLYHSLIVKWHL